MLTKALVKEIGMIKQAVKKPVYNLETLQRQFRTIAEENFEIDSEILTVKVVHNNALLKHNFENEKTAESV